MLGKRNTDPPQHAKLLIPITKAVDGDPSSKTGRILIGNVKNPPSATPTGINLRITR